MTYDRSGQTDKQQTTASLARATWLRTFSYRLKNVATGKYVSYNLMGECVKVADAWCGTGVQLANVMARDEFKHLREGYVAVELQPDVRYAGTKSTTKYNGDAIGIAIVERKKPL